VRPSLIVGCSILSAAWFGGCSHPIDCSVDYRGGCVPGTAAPAATVPAGPDLGPSNAVPATSRPDAGPATAAPAAVRLGDPSEFADVDDKQCRSYGLTFGTHDYADCRIRLSAQHRGLDPNIGTRTPVPGNR